MPLTAGTRLGQYEIINALGAGGMGEVFRARDTSLNRDVALKVLPALFANDPERLARFKREAQVLASLNHPNIAIVHGLEQADGIQAIVMELVEGSTLADRVAQGPIPTDEALAIARQIVDALEAAHEHGIVHRDLKPANISVRADGVVKVLDFGLAKAMQPEASGVASVSMSPTLSSPAMSQAGIIIGTAAYMSPEQARGKPVDKRADIWAFGCVLFEMLTGKRAFEGEDVSLTLAEVMKSEPNLGALPPDFPPRVLSALKLCLQKDPKRRVRDIGDVRIAIDGGFENAPPAVQPAKGPQRPFWRQLVPWTTGILAGAAIVGIVWALRPPAPVPWVTRFSVALGSGQVFTNTGRHSLAISPDGTKIVYVANQRLMLRLIGDLEPRLLAGTQGGVVNSPVFSPDGLSVAFFADSLIKKVGVNGGNPSTLCPATNPFGMSWGPDGIVFAQNPGGIMRVSEGGGKPELLVPVKDGEVTHGPQMLPNGDTILFTLARNAADWDTAQVVAYSLKSGERRLLIDGGSDARYLPTGHLVYAVGGVLFASRFDPERIATIGTAAPVVEGVRRAGGATGAAQFSVSATGSLVYVPGPASVGVARRSLTHVDRNGVVTVLKLPAGPYDSPRVSPDGAYVAFGSDDGKEVAVFIYDLSGKAQMRRLTLSGASRFPVWSPDSRSVAFQSDRDGNRGIFRQRVDGSGTFEQLTTSEAGTSHAPESWSPNGQTLLFSSMKDSHVSLWTLTLPEKKIERFGRLESLESMDPVFSPDGHWVAYDAVDAGMSRVFVEAFPSRTDSRYELTGQARNPFWSADGTRLIYAPAAAELSAVTVSAGATVAFGNPTAVPRGGLTGPPGGAGGRRSYDPAPNDNGVFGFVLGEVVENQSGTTLQVVLNWFEELKQRVPVK